MKLPNTFYTARALPLSQNMGKLHSRYHALIIEPELPAPSYHLVHKFTHFIVGTIQSLSPEHSGKPFQNGTLLRVRNLLISYYNLSVASLWPVHTLSFLPAKHVLQEDT